MGEEQQQRNEAEDAAGIWRDEPEEEGKRTESEQQNERETNVDDEDERRSSSMNKLNTWNGTSIAGMAQNGAAKAQKRQMNEDSRGGKWTKREDAKMRAGQEQINPARILHSITILDLEQYHSITERYRFAIPELQTRCICECESGSANCAADRYKYGQCGQEGNQNEDSNNDDHEEENTADAAGGTWRRQRNAAGGGLIWAQNMQFAAPKSSAPSVCHRTFFANQPTGQHCSRHADASSSARLCCQLRFRAHRQRSFMALRLENAISSVLLQYSQWAWIDKAHEMQQNGREQTKSANTERVGGGGEDPTNRSEERMRNAQKPEEQQQQHWIELDRRKMRIQLDGAVHNLVLNELSGLKLSVLGFGGAKSATAQLEPGVYFAESQPDGSLGELIGQMPVNRITEHDFHKLGWLRLDERGEPFVQSGEIYLDKIHHARVDDCAEQRFRSVLDASYYVNADNNASTHFKLANPLNSVHKWIRSARVLDSHQRIALIRAREGLSLEVTLTVAATANQSPRRPPSRDVDEQQQQQQQRQRQKQQQQTGRPLPMITFVHNSSRLADFTAMLVLDRFSNSILNLTLFNASGILNGIVRPMNANVDDAEADVIDGFSVHVPMATVEESADGWRNPDSHMATSPDWQPVSVQISIRPYPLGSIHVVCLRPDDANVSLELCRPVQSVYHELEVNTVRNEWNEAVGECKRCNQISAEGFAKYLNPANWTKGISSVSDALMMASDIVGYFVGILVIYALLSKVVFPLLGCCCTNCVPSPTSFFFCKKRNKT